MGVVLITTDSQGVVKRFECDGVNDQEVINAALEIAGKVRLYGWFNCSGPIHLRRGVDIVGEE